VLQVVAISKQPPARAHKSDRKRPEFATCTMSITFSGGEVLDLWATSATLADAWVSSFAVVVEEQQEQQLEQQEQADQQQQQQQHSSTGSADATAANATATASTTATAAAADAKLADTAKQQQQPQQQPQAAATSPGGTSRGYDALSRSFHSSSNTVSGPVFVRDRSASTLVTSLGAVVGGRGAGLLGGGILSPSAAAAAAVHTHTSGAHSFGSPSSKRASTGGAGSGGSGDADMARSGSFRIFTGARERRAARQRR
jgi:hypothetical protein